MEERFIENLIEALEIEEHEVSLSDEFRNYEEWDSLNRLSLIAMLDDEYNLQIETEEFESLKTVEDLMNRINEDIKE